MRAGGAGVVSLVVSPAAPTDAILPPLQSFRAGARAGISHLRNSALPRLQSALFGAHRGLEHGVGALSAYAPSTTVGMYPQDVLMVTDVGERDGVVGAADGADAGSKQRPIPSALGGLTALQEVHLQTNELSGPIPSYLEGLTALQQLVLYENDLTGAIPPELGGLRALTVLNLKVYNLTGAIPPELGGLTELNFLILRSNNLTGSIPRELAQLKVLKEAAFFGNNFSGTKEDVQQLLPDCDVCWHSLSG